MTGAHNGVGYDLTFTVGAYPIRVIIGSVIDENFTVGTHTVNFVLDSDTPLIQFCSLVSSGGTATVDNASLESNNNITPTNLAIEVTNTEALASPAITLTSGALPVNSIICITSITTSHSNLLIHSSGQDILLDSTGAKIQSAFFIKSSAGWSPIIATLP
jgi:hypothetical protein